MMEIFEKMFVSSAWNDYLTENVNVLWKYFPHLLLDIVEFRSKLLLIEDLKKHLLLNKPLFPLQNEN